MFLHARSLAAAGAGTCTLLALLPICLGGDPAVAADAPPDTTRLYYADEVVVTASRYDDDVHLSHTNLTAEQIAREQTAADIPMLLADVPGVYAYSDAGNGIGYTYLKIRGFDQRRVAVLVNGIPLNDPEDHQVYWVDLPDLASSLEDVQVQRGITNSVGGVTAIGGTVNLVTDVLSSAPEGRATLEAGSYGTARRVLSYQTGELGDGFSTGLRLSQLESDGYRERAGSEQWAVFWSGRWQHGAHSLQANIYTGHELTHHAWDPVDEATLAVNRRANPETYHNAVDDFRQPHHELHWEWDLTDHLLLRNSLYQIHGEGFYENFRDGDAPAYGLDAAFPDRYTADDEVSLVRTKWVRKDQTGWLPSLQWDHAGGRLVVGGDWYTFHSNHWGDVLLAYPGEAGVGLTPADIPDGLKYHDFTGDKDAWSLFASERWEFLPGLTLLLDVQHQHREYDFLQQEVAHFTGEERNAYGVAYDFFNPKGGLFWQTPWRVAGGEIGLFAHAGITHREPADAEYWDTWYGPDDLGVDPLFASRREVLDAAGNVDYVQWSDPLVEPERVVDWEGGLAVRARELSFTLNGYWMDFENEIVPSGYYDPDRGVLRGNADQTLHRGVELGLRWQPVPDHGLSLAASRSWNEYESFIFNDYDWDADMVVPRDFSGNPIPLFPDHLVSATWTSRVGPVSGDLQVRRVGKQYLDNTGDEARTIAPATVVDLAVFWRLGRAARGLTASLRILNLLDEEYETWGYYDPYGAGNYKLPAATRNWLAGITYDF